MDAEERAGKIVVGYTVTRRGEVLGPDDIRMVVDITAHEGTATRQYMSANLPLEVFDTSIDGNEAWEVIHRIVGASVSRLLLDAAFNVERQAWE